MRKQINLCLLMIFLLTAGKVLAQDFTISVSQPSGTNTALIKWTVIPPYNMRYFVIEALRGGQPGICYSEIGKLIPAATQQIPTNYSFTHSAPVKGYTYYRVKIVNLDDQVVAYSNLAAFNCTSCPQPPPGPICNTPSGIIGPNFICSTGQFTISNGYPAQLAVTWSVIPTGIVTLDQTDPCNIKLTKLKNGVVTLKAARTGCTGTINKQIVVGTPTLSLSGENTAFYYPTFTRYSVDVTLLPGTTASSYQWYKNGAYLGTGAIRTISVYNTDGCVDVQVKVTTACGESSGSMTLCFQEPPSCSGVARFSVGPVPAKSKLTISKAAPPPPCETQARLNTTGDLHTISVLDMNGTLKKQVNNVSLKNNYQLDVNNLPDGNYILRIIAPDQKEEVKQIRVEN